MEIKNADLVTLKRAEDEIINGGIGLIITTGYGPEKDYRIRRLAVDLGIPIILNHKLGLELSKAVAFTEKNYEALEIKELREFWNRNDIIKIL
jgi:carbamoyl-phosphate synthase large subunit